MVKDKMSSGTAGLAVPTEEPTIVVEQDRKMYHVGTLPGCSHHNVTVGGICFPEETEVVTLNPNTRLTDRSKRKGDIIPLTQIQVDRIKKAVGERVIRWMGAHKAENGEEIPRRGFIRVTTDKRFSPGPTDEPIAKYLYMDELASGALQMKEGGRPLA